jgi:periplasmic protein TonB
MPRDLFGDVTRPSISIGSRKWYTLPLSLVSHSAIVLLLIAIPILAPAVMPSVFADGDLMVITAILPTPPPPPAPRINTTPTPPRPDPNAAPLTPPDGFTPEPIDRSIPDEPLPGVIGGTVVDGDAVLAPPPPPAVISPPEPVRVGHFGVRNPVKTVDVRPIYPPIAQAAHIQGIVIIEATISVDGRVTNARILRSMPLLDQAAIDAVRQWQFTPTLLNGVPVPVIMTVTVNFTLR